MLVDTANYSLPTYSEDTFVEAVYMVFILSSLIEHVTFLQTMGIFIYSRYSALLGIRYMYMHSRLQYYLYIQFYSKMNLIYCTG